MVKVFKQKLPKQCFICRKTSSPIGLNFGDFLNDHFGEFILGGNYIRRGELQQRAHTQIRITNLCLFPLNVEFFLQAIKSIH